MKKILLWVAIAGLCYALINFYLSTLKTAFVKQEQHQIDSSLKKGINNALSNFKQKEK